MALPGGFGRLGVDGGWWVSNVLFGPVQVWRQTVRLLIVRRQGPLLG
jgi:hypothetical protein